MASDYLAQPDAPAPGVLVVHDWYGLLPHVQDQCDQLAEAGFLALAPDLYDGASTTDPSEAERLLGALDATRARERLAAAADRLRERAAPARVGAIGYSMGGSLALLLAAAGGLDAVVGYYAALEQDELAPIDCPVLLQLAAVDEWEPPDQPERFAAWLRDKGTVVEVRTWPDTEHSFANADVALYAPDQAAEAWSLTLEFLRRHLVPTVAA
ncbi:MAG TPA: alpha/beta fold hydrolase [Actinomycetes bacterium]|nr:alpha/beta fold hydrolase [Actinomycetes bacterium]